jgi:pimeloyl-ACP methyl ester carboxylesterase
MFNFRKLLGKGQQEPLKLPVNAREEIWQWRDHKIVYSVLGEGAPLLALHGINAAAWGYELRRNLEPLSQKYRVYAPDLPGFGRSERKKMRYTAGMYIDFIRDFARYIAEKEGQAPAVLALSLTAAHTISAVSRNPENFGPLLLVCPTGYEKLAFEQSSRARKAQEILSGPVGDAVFFLLTTRWSTRVFLGRDGYYDQNYVSPDLIENYHRAARQPNAKYAPVGFVTFALNHSVAGEWNKVQQPTVIVWGREAMITPLSTAQRFLDERPGTELKVIDRARLGVQDEQAEEFNAFALDWFVRHHHPATQSQTSAA